MSADLLAVLESYYDAAPRPVATTEAVGPFTLFLKTDPDGWDFYARPRLGLDRPVTTADVIRVRARQRQHGVAENLEWVHQTTPSLLEAARADGLDVAECPLLVLPASTDPQPGAPTQTRVMTADSPDLGAVIATIGAAFADTDEVTPQDPCRRADQIRSGTLVVVGAYDERGAVVGGGSHAPRGDTTELTGIGVLPRARRTGVGAAVTQALVADARQRGVGTVFLSAQDDAVARVYERVGFERVGTACVAEGGRHGG